MIKVALIGCGRRGLDELRHLSTFEDVELAAVCDPAPEARPSTTCSNARLASSQCRMAMRARLPAIWCMASHEFLSSVQHRVDPSFAAGWIP